MFKLLPFLIIIILSLTGIKNTQSFKYYTPSIRNVSRYPVNKNNKLRVAIVDTGIDFTHPELKCFMVKGSAQKDYSFWHGTHVAGIITRGIKCGDVELINAHCHFSILFGIDVSQCTRELMKLLNNPPDIINISMSGRYIYPLERKILKQLADHGSIIVVASGNDYSPKKAIPTFPCAYKSTICIGAYYRNRDKSLEIPMFNNSIIDFIAPGKLISTMPNGKYSIQYGSSFASPYIVNKIIKYLLKGIKDPVGQLKKLANPLPDKAKYGIIY